MRYLVLCLFFALTTNSVYAWETLISCDNGRFIVEQERRENDGHSSGYMYRQMIIRNPDIQNYFVAQGAFGNYSQGRYNGYYPDTQELLVVIDNVQNWGMSGGYDFNVFSSYHADTVRISYYINYRQADSVEVNAYANWSSFIPGVVLKGNRANWMYHGCYIKR